MRSYVTITEVKRHVNSTTTGREDSLYALVEATTRWVELQCNRRFDRRLAELFHRAYRTESGGDLSDAHTLILRDDLIAASTVLNGDGVEVDSYRLTPEEGDAYHGIRLNPRLAVTWTAGGESDPDYAIAVDGEWGFGGSWEPSGVTVTGDITSTATTIGITVGTGSSLPERYQQLRIGSEYVYVVSASGSSMVVKRGYNGSSAAAHSAGAAIDVFVPDARVRQLVLRVLSWRLEQLKAPLFGTLTVGDFQLPVNTSSLPQDIQGMILALMKRKRLRAVGA